MTPQATLPCALKNNLTINNSEFITTIQSNVLPAHECCYMISNQESKMRSRKVLPISRREGEMQMYKLFLIHSSENCTRSHGVAWLTKKHINILRIL